MTFITSQAALTTHKSFKSYQQIIIPKLQSKFKFDRNLPMESNVHAVLSSHKFSLGLTFMVNLVICIKKKIKLRDYIYLFCVKLPQLNQKQILKAHMYLVIL